MQADCTFIATTIRQPLRVYTSPYYNLRDVLGDLADVSSSYAGIGPAAISDALAAGISFGGNSFGAVHWYPPPCKAWPTDPCRVTPPHEFHDCGLPSQ